MPVDFQFVPPVGDLSGESFESQVEQAFNDLGVNIDDIKDTADEALSVANDALTQAENAISQVQTAIEAATEATEAANTAIATAGTALSTAQAAQSTANEANDTAQVAQTTANEANENAQAAQTTANQAHATATTAEGLANTASIVANAALEEARGAGGTYQETDALIVIDEEISTRKLYLTNTSITGLPVSVPLYFTVSSTSTGDSAMQEVFSQSGEGPYVRTATIVVSQTEPPVVTWSDWETLSGGSGFIRGDINLQPFRPSELPRGWYLATAIYTP